ncbi:hypothetical protein Tco_1089469, partial [Tanacetum coccineum]
GCKLNPRTYKLKYLDDNQEEKMKLSPREVEKLMAHNAGFLA